ncbi:unsaturated rhamnogalacturonyl hydrolase [Elusimicrobium posterum]|uniref:glycoside hydrolase family 88/105 protein n=1 Tax=Elusimicrobium posterum TaxID=3116653 RepID=UPI003C753C4A
MNKFKMGKKVKSLAVISIIAATLLASFFAYRKCSVVPLLKNNGANTTDIKVLASSFAVLMADSEIKRRPAFYMYRWDYDEALVLQSMYELYKKNGDKKYYDYVKQNFDEYLLNDGHEIATYKARDYNLDMINPGKVLFLLYKDSGEQKYRNALSLIRSQLLKHPRTSEGGFYHKALYPQQMWLDGIYMASPFAAQYGASFNEYKLIDEAARQITLIAKKTYDPKTGLYYHGWDEAKAQYWADPETGLSSNFWSRSIGWYMMGMVDTLDFIPKNHPKRAEIINILRGLAASIENYRDPETGMWFQVTDKGGAKGNYVESSASAMFIYAWAKGANKGYLDASYSEKAQAAYRQFLETFIKQNCNGTISVTKGCAVAGLGGNAYRDGSYEYYISEPVRNDDPKAVGPFILASLQFL